MVPPKLHLDLYRAADWSIIGDRTSGACAPIAALRNGWHAIRCAGSSLVSITVLSVTPAHAGKFFALVSVLIDIDGAQIEVHGAGEIA